MNFLSDQRKKHRTPGGGGGSEGGNKGRRPVVGGSGGGGEKEKRPNWYSEKNHRRKLDSGGGGKHGYSERWEKRGACRRYRGKKEKRGFYKNLGNRKRVTLFKVSHRLGESRGGTRRHFCKIGRGEGCKGTGKKMGNMARTFHPNRKKRKGVGKKKARGKQGEEAQGPLNSVYGEILNRARERPKIKTTHRLGGF